jgi:5,10-methylene-tetrahydrofolate dehydrogenase/methenyl tetrahydrofolate cyclohydrolase
MARIIDGKVISEQIRQELKVKVSDLKTKTGKCPGLAVILVGERKDSVTYVNAKKRASEEVGFTFHLFKFPEDAKESDVIDKVEECNRNEEIHGLLVQLPLPPHMDERRVTMRVAYEKDVDGFDIRNTGGLAKKGGNPLSVPCTPKACIELLDRSGLPIAGKHAVVLGRSNIVGIPAALLLLHRDATVTICHSKTVDLEAQLKQADILIAAAGRAELVRGEWLKPGAVVIDVGINSVTDTSKASGYKLVGDVHFDSASKVASAITPVPGGVGPMTVAMLLTNTLEGFLRTLNGNKE